MLLGSRHVELVGTNSSLRHRRHHTCTPGQHISVFYSSLQELLAIEDVGDQLLLPWFRLRPADRSNEHVGSNAGIHASHPHTDRLQSGTKSYSCIPALTSVAACSSTTHLKGEIWVVPSVGMCVRYYSQMISHTHQVILRSTSANIQSICRTF